MENESTIELSCISCKSRRNLTMVFTQLEEGFNVFCHRHYTEHLKGKIVRLSELLKPDKKESIKRPGKGS